MAANEIDLKEILMDCQEAEALLEQQQQEKEALIKQKARDSGTLVKNFIKRVSNRYFYLFKPYGFLCYPIDRGSFLTKDLHSLTQAQDDQPAAAWKGYLKPDNQKGGEEYGQRDKLVVISYFVNVPKTVNQTKVRNNLKNFIFYKKKRLSIHSKPLIYLPIKPCFY